MQKAGRSAPAWSDELDFVQLFVPSLGQIKDVKYKAVLRKDTAKAARKR